MSWPNVVVFLGFVYAIVIVIVTGLVAGNWMSVRKAQLDERQAWWSAQHEMYRWQQEERDSG